MLHLKNGCMIALSLFLLASSNAAATAFDGDAIAIVNGKPLPKQDMVELLIESHGLEALQQLIVLELAHDEAERRGLTVSDADVQAEVKSALELMSPEGASAGG